MGVLLVDVAHVVRLYTNHVCKSCTCLKDLARGPYLSHESVSAGADIAAFSLVGGQCSLHLLNDNRIRLVA